MQEKKCFVIPTLLFHLFCLVGGFPAPLWDLAELRGFQSTQSPAGQFLQIPSASPKGKQTERIQIATIPLQKLPLDIGAGQSSWDFSHILSPMLGVWGD